MSNAAQSAVSSEVAEAERSDAANAAVVATADAASALSFGPRLAQARQALGWSVGEVASRLRLHPRQITALEEERLDALPAATFTRGFVRNYAKELNLDPNPLLAALNQKLGPVAGDDLSQLPSSSRVMLETRLSNASMITALVGGLVVLGIIGWVASLAKRASSEPTSLPRAPVAAPKPATEPAPVAATPDAVTATAAPAAASTAASTPASPVAATAQPAANTGASAPASGIKPATPLTAAAPASSAPVAPAPVPTKTTTTSTAGDTATRPGATTAVLKLSFSDRPSWVEISLPDGRVVYSALNDANTERRIVVQPPFRLVVGNASSVAVEYRGRNVDLKPHIRNDDLARLNLE